jgi:hypothetical protein
VTDRALVRFLALCCLRVCVYLSAQSSPFVVWWFLWSCAETDCSLVQSSQVLYELFTTKSPSEWLYLVNIFEIITKESLVIWFTWLTVQVGNEQRETHQALMTVELAESVVHAVCTASSCITRCVCPFASRHLLPSSVPPLLVPARSVGPRPADPGWLHPQVRRQRMERLGQLHQHDHAPVTGAPAERNDEDGVDA